MKIWKEMPLTHFEFWAGGKDTVEDLTDSELEQIEQILEHIYPEGLSEGELNDLFWFERDLIAEWLGYENFDEIIERDKMKKIIAKEVNPEDVDFSFYFDDDGLKSIGGENCAVYIVPANERWNAGFNMDEYKEIELHAQAVIGDCEAGYPIDEALKEWAEYASVYDTEDIAEFLTITTGEKWEVRSFFGYSQGDCCDVVYCVNHYTPERITEIGELWLGCGTEFCIDGCCGYYVPNSIRWREGETLRKYLADSYGCEPEELEIYLYDGEKYEKMD